ncbi:alkylation response protein AidB-like acyl-CoA dehydrogenase [Rhizobium sp. BK313]|uniref:acyl-CoA dehydrogenase family protein n=1 Tax=Rhizobium sp. BK313 TaxID=2587081 RepID=UPI00105DFC6E|nr:acyl-CoA dehydrogenase family protein [Rhizobium sp. BK313]MBB3452142.1 alkylation response protein AidB-like acyl-CoA dehydrogenase [Rhizobium sp. BK313]
MGTGEATVKAAVIDRVRALESVANDHRAEFDQLRRMPPAVMQAIIDNDLLRLWAPASVGGAALSAHELVDVIIAASEIEGAIGWMLTNSAAASRLAAFLPPHFAHAWFASPRSLTTVSTAASGRALPADGGYRISGRWPFCSSSQEATRFCGLCEIVTPENSTDTPELIFVHLDIDSVKIEDNWQVSGLRGTGSCDVVVDDVFVEANGVHPFVNPEPREAGLLYRLPTLSIFPLTVSIVPLGLARAALKEFRSLATKRSRAGSSLPLAEREWIQFEIGRAEAHQRGAHAFILKALDELTSSIDSAPERWIEARVNFRLALTYSANACIEAVNIIAACAGTSAIQETHRIERIGRDMAAATKHVAMSANNYLVAGRVALGQPPGVSRF